MADKELIREVKDGVRRMEKKREKEMMEGITDKDGTWKEWMTNPPKEKKDGKQ